MGSRAMSRPAAAGVAAAAAHGGEHAHCRAAARELRRMRGRGSWRRMRATCEAARAGRARRGDARPPAARRLARRGHGAQLEDIAALPDPIGTISAEWTRPNGLRIQRVRVPLGVIGIIYESRPNVTADAGALCLKSGQCRRSCVAVARAIAPTSRSTRAWWPACAGGPAASLHPAGADDRPCGRRPHARRHRPTAST